MIKMAQQQPQPPRPNPFVKFQEEIKQSFETFKAKHNEIAETLTKLEEKFTELNEKYNELSEFLTFNNKRYRKFFHKKHLKNKFK